MTEVICQIMKRTLTGILLVLATGIRAETLRFNADWQFFKGEIEHANLSEFDSKAWEKIHLPHTAHIEPLIVNDLWMGICWYRKTFSVPEAMADKKVWIEFKGAMNYSKVWINGKLAGEHQGGYLPVVIDATDFIHPGSNIIAVRLDNTDNPVTGPKPHFKTDFCKYGGLYRDATLTFKEKVYLSHPLLAGKKAGGGVFITTPVVSKKESVVQVKTHLMNEFDVQKNATVRLSIYSGETVVAVAKHSIALPAGNDAEVCIPISVTDAKLWSPRTPHLYQLKTEVIVDGAIADSQTDRFGIREFKFVDNQLFINGEKSFLRGVNRHQEYPFIGYAISDNARVRDARLIKEAGFDLIRLSHYPQSPAFMDACDELGIVVLDAILGWQYYSEDKAFNEYCCRSARDLVRRDRNHPCVLAWEVSLNETTMPVPFMQKLHKIVHAEYPGEQTYTCGWMPEVYDIFLQARQHRILHGDAPIGDKPYLVSEYGDWEYYSRNAGLNQDQLDPMARIEQSSRQLRGFGEKRLKQQAFNVQESHNDNRANTPAFADAYWAMFDYNSGCHDNLCYCGLMDIFRLPKPACWFYRSQRDPAEEVVLHISTYWNEKSPLDIKIYSNCDEVELLLNGRSIGRRQPDQDSISTALKHPPFTFNLSAFEAGELQAVGYIAGKKVEEHRIKTPGEPVRLQIRVDDAGLTPAEDDTVFIRISAVDAEGTLVPDYCGKIDIAPPEGITVLNTGEIECEAGIATALVRYDRFVHEAVFTASTGNGIEPASLRLYSNRSETDRNRAGNEDGD